MTCLFVPLRERPSVYRPSKSASLRRRVKTWLAMLSTYPIHPEYWTTPDQYNAVTFSRSPTP
ncbi:MAG: hypothetical protein WBB45_11490 [Cyclobacteriaceae bacterium]